MKRHFLSINAACLLLAMLATAPVFAQSNIPQMINYQGYLTDAEGNPEDTGEYTLTFAIYDAASGGTMTWGPKEMGKVPVVRGHFNVILGPTDGATDTTGKSIALAFTGPEAYLAVKVTKTSAEGKSGGEGEVNAEGESTEGWISPRQRILSTPYAIQAEHSAFDVPIGAIIPWIPPSKTTPAKDQVPRGFKICSGAQTEDSSTPFNEALIPDLTGRFLRGSAEKDVGATGGRTDIPSDGAHRHTGWTAYAEESGSRKENGNDGMHTHRHRHEISSDGAHSHGGDNLPPYYGIIMIIRVF